MEFSDIDLPWYGKNNITSLKQNSMDRNINTACNTAEEIPRRLETMIDSMPAFPKSVQRIMQLTSDINCSPTELVQVIEHDPIITTKILKLLNSAYYNLPRKISSIKRSIVYIGLNTIKNMALSIASVGMLPKKNTAGFDYKELLAHSVSTAAIAKLLCEKLGPSDGEPSDFFVAGLIHDFGKIVFARSLPEEFNLCLTQSRDENRPLDELENEIIGTDHAKVGALLVEKWHFPAPLVSCVKGHHHPDLTTDEMSDCIITADVISKTVVQKTIPCVPDPISSVIETRFGMEIEELIISLGDLDKELAEANSLAYL